MDHKKQLMTLKQIGFSLFDMNCDNIVCDFDLFSLVRQTEEEFFIEYISQDIKDIRYGRAERIEKFPQLQESTTGGSASVTPRQKSVANLDKSEDNSNFDWNTID